MVAETDVETYVVYDGGTEVVATRDMRTAFKSAREHATKVRRKVELVKRRTIIQHVQTVYPQG